MSTGTGELMVGGRTISWDTSSETVLIIDQTLLPGTYREITCRTVPALIEAIQRLAVRGAPVLGVAGGYGVALAACTTHEAETDRFKASVRKVAAGVREARPTAVNLAWGVNRVLQAVENACSVAEARELAIQEAEAIATEDIASCLRIAEAGAALFPDRCTVLTHCNAGALACITWGTALGVIRSAVNMGKQIRVIASETRPLLQGARLTAWELCRDGIDVRVIPDSSAAHLMRQGYVDSVIVGADRITQDAVFNKIGTYMHAVCARHHGIPFYVAAPWSTFDLAHRESEIRIEERGRDELSRCGNHIMIPDGAGVINYAFDATPLDLVAAFITDRGILHPPFSPE